MKTLTDIVDGTQETHAAVQALAESLSLAALDGCDNDIIHWFSTSEHYIYGITGNSSFFRFSKLSKATATARSKH